MRSEYDVPAKTLDRVERLLLDVVDDEIDDFLALVTEAAQAPLAVTSP